LHSGADKAGRPPVAHARPLAAAIRPNKSPAGGTAIGGCIGERVDDDNGLVVYLRTRYNDATFAGFALAPIRQINGGTFGCRPKGTGQIGHMLATCFLGLGVAERGLLEWRSLRVRHSSEERLSASCRNLSAYEPEPAIGRSGRDFRDVP
jgi:hypothetical protein